MLESNPSQPKPKKVDPIASKLKKRPEVNVIDGKAFYLSLESGKPISRRVGVPVFDKEHKPKHLLGAFESIEEVCNYIQKSWSNKEINDKRKDKLIDDLTTYAALPQAERDEFESKVGVVAALPKSKSEPKPKPAKAPKPEVSASAADAVTPPVPAAASGGFVVFPMDLGDNDQPIGTASSILEALAGSKTEENISHLEVVLVPGIYNDAVFFRQLQAPSAQVLKSISRVTGRDADQLKTNKLRGRDSKFSVVMRKKQHKKFMAQRKAAMSASKKQRTVNKKRQEQSVLAEPIVATADSVVPVDV